MILVSFLFEEVLKIRRSSFSRTPGRKPRKLGVDSPIWKRGEESYMYLGPIGDYSQNVSQIYISGKANNLHWHLECTPEGINWNPPAGFKLDLISEISMHARIHELV